MKTNFFHIIFILLPGLIRSQSIFIKDASTNEPIINAIVSDKKGQTQSTDVTGKADLSKLFINDSLTIFHSAYRGATILFNGDGKDQNVLLYSKAILLDEVIFAANRSKEKKIDVPYSIEVIKQKDIEFANQPTTGEVVLNTGAVFVQKSQLGGSSPVLRGFEASRVLLVVDGVRMNNAIYRAGHLQDIITLDPNMLERVEILFGPSSTLYGSDALGGVLHFYTKDPKFSAGENKLVKANAMYRIATVNNESTGHFDFNIGSKNISSMTNITYSSFGDLMSGSTKLTGYYKGWDRPYYASRINERDTVLRNDNDNLQIGTAYDQFDIMQRFKIKTGEHFVHDLNFQMSQSSDVPRYDRLTEVTTSTVLVYNANSGLYERAYKPKFAEWKYGPQKRMLGAYSFNYDKRTFLSDNVKVIFAYQKIDQDRITRRFQNNNRTNQNEDVKVLSINADLFKKIKEVHELRYGLELTANDVTSTANALNIVTNSVSPAVTRYADGGSDMRTGALYFSHSWEVNDRFVISDGVRFTATSLECKFVDTTFYKFPFKTAEQKSNAVTGNLGFTWKEAESYKVSILLNTGFRTPNVDDMSKVFESAGSKLVVPNPNIKPEYATNFEAGITKIFEKRYKIDLSGFYTIVENAMILKDYKFNGSDSALFNGTKAKVQAMQNADRAYIYGFSAGLLFEFNDNLVFKSSLNYTYGRYIDSKRDTVLPLDHIPPVFGQTSIIFKGKGNDAEFFVRYNGKKSSADYSLSGEDNASYSADPTRGYMPSWFTLNLRLGYNITKTLRFNLACENITDNRYRLFASGINAPGRNFIFSLRYRL